MSSSRRNGRIHHAEICNRDTTVLASRYVCRGLARLVRGAVCLFIGSVVWREVDPLMARLESRWEEPSEAVSCGSMLEHPARGAENRGLEGQG